MLVLVSTLLYAILVMILRSLREKISILHSLFFFNVANVVISFPFVYCLEKSEWNYEGILIVIILSISSTIG
jgi:hypothetical protein